MIAQVDVYATWISRTTNTIPNSQEKFRKQGNKASD